MISANPVGFIAVTKYEKQCPIKCSNQKVMRYVDYTNCCVYRVDLPDDEQQACSKYIEA